MCVGVRVHRKMHVAKVGCIPSRVFVCVCKVHVKRKDWQELDWVGLCVSLSFFWELCVCVCGFLRRR